MLNLPKRSKDPKRQCSLILRCTQDHKKYSNKASLMILSAAEDHGHGRFLSLLSFGKFSIVRPDVSLRST